MKIKINKPSIKLTKSVVIKLAVAVLVLILVGLIGITVGDRWEQKQNIKNQKIAAQLDAQAEKDAKASKAIADYNLYVNAYEKERVNCEKGRAVYDLHTTSFAKSTIKKENVPQCGPAVPRP